MTTKKQAREGVAELGSGGGEAGGGNGKDGVAEGLLRGAPEHTRDRSHIRPSADCQSQDTPETRPVSQRFPEIAASFLESQPGPGQDTVNLLWTASLSALLASDALRCGI